MNKKLQVKATSIVKEAIMDGEKVICGSGPISEEEGVELEQESEELF